MAPSKRNRLRLARRPAARAQPAHPLPHVEVLRAGARAWNAWRRQNPGIVPVLNDLNISVTERQFGRVQGGPINLSRAEFHGARLDQATLIEANLMGAVLTEADLSDARLEHADLRGARLACAALGPRTPQGRQPLRHRPATGARSDAGPDRSGCRRPPHGSAGTPVDAEGLAPAGPVPTTMRMSRRQASVREPSARPIDTQRLRERQATSAPPVSRFVIAVAVAGAIGVGVLTTMIDAKLERRGVAPGDAPSAARAMVQDGGSQTPPAVPYAPSG